MRTLALWLSIILIVIALGGLGFFVLHGRARPQTVGSVNTAFKLIGPDHKIVIESYDDPKIDGITVFVSEARTGGVKGGLGLAQDTSDADIAVRQTGPIRVKEDFEGGEDVFTERRSALFKRLHVSRFWDADHKTFVYLVWSDKVLNGSPKNAISAVVAGPWGTVPADLGPLQLQSGVSK